MNYPQNKNEVKKNDKGGRPPKPTSLKILEGNPGKRPLNENEPQPKIGIPPLPGWLNDPRAIEVWNDLGPKLKKIGLITEIDGYLFGMLCQSFVMFVEYSAKLLNDRDFNIDDKRKCSSIVNENFKAMRILSSLFGLSPSDRSRLSVQTSGNKEDEILD